MRSDVLYSYLKVTIFAKSLILLILCLVRYQAALHPDWGDHNRRTPVKSILLAKKVTEECGIKKNGCMPQYRLASHTISSHPKINKVTFR